MFSRFALVAFLLASTAPALAQDAPPPPLNAGSPAPQSKPPVPPEVLAARKAMRQACAADMKTYCADAQPGHGQVMQCMKAHAAQLSQGCKDSFAALHAARHAPQPPG